MREKLFILLVSALSAGAVSASSQPPGAVPEKIQALFTQRPPRSLEAKVEEADLIVRGKATLFVEDKWVLDFAPTPDKAWMGLGNNPPELDSCRPFTLYQRDLRIDVTAVLWPPSLKRITNIVFSRYVVKERPTTWRAYTNASGIFFLTKAASPEQGEWTMLEPYDDRMEPTTNAPSVQAAITKVKERGRTRDRQPDGAANGSQPIRVETNRASSAAGSRR